MSKICFIACDEQTVKDGRCECNSRIGDALTAAKEIFPITDNWSKEDKQLWAKLRRERDGKTNN